MKIACLVSGGVDSSTSLYLLQKQGFQPEAFYIKIWMEDDFFDCPWKEDLSYVEKVTQQLKVKLNVVSMQKEYWDKIINYTLKEVKKGRTPNPDVFCNTFIKFGLFNEKYGKSFDKIATGHYAKSVISKRETDNCHPELYSGSHEIPDPASPAGGQVRNDKEEYSIKQNSIYLFKATDPSKDQSYFLSQLTQEQLSRCLFPVGNLLKSEVREIAKNAKLATSQRPDSQGLCFLGKVNFRQFLEKYVGTKKGKIVDLDTQKIVGEHQGHWFYTIGQREGLKIGGAGKPYYVAEKDSEENIIYVVKDHDNKVLWKDQIILTDLNILAKNEFKTNNVFDVQLRYHSTIVKGKIEKRVKDRLEIRLEEPYFAVASGQIGVLYLEDLVVGSGIIA